MYEVWFYLVLTDQNLCQIANQTKPLGLAIFQTKLKCSTWKTAWISLIWFGLVGFHGLAIFLNILSMINMLKKFSTTSSSSFSMLTCHSWVMSTWSKYNLGSSRVWRRSCREISPNVEISDILILKWLSSSPLIIRML